MQEDLLDAFLVFIVMMIGITSGGILYIRHWLKTKEKKNPILRAIFCLKIEEEVKLHIARSPTDSDIENGRKKTILSRLENIAEELKSPFKSPVTPTTTIFPELDSTPDRWAYYPNSTRTIAFVQDQKRPVVHPTFSSPIRSAEITEKKRRYST